MSDGSKDNISVKTIQAPYNKINLTVSGFPMKEAAKNNTAVLFHLRIV